MFKKILVCLDGSQYSSKAFPYATEIAKRFNSEVMLLHVVRPAPVNAVPASPESGMSPLALQLLADNAEQQDQNNIQKGSIYLKRKLRQLTSKGIKGSQHVLIGEPARVILEFCKENKIDLVVMTTTGKGGIKRAVLGSTTDVIMRAPGFPVLAIRPRD